MMMTDSKARSLVKGITWRMVGSLDTFLLAWLFFGHWDVALPVAIAELFTKILLYFAHERIWNRIGWGRKANRTAHFRSLSKGISWRFFGSVDTFLLGWIFSGNPLASVKLSFTEVITKVLLFYVHERIWAGIRWGRIYLHESKADNANPL